MKKKLFGIAIFAGLAAAAVGGLRRFGPTLAERGMKKCHEMMGQAAQKCPPFTRSRGEQEEQPVAETT